MLEKLATPTVTQLRAIGTEEALEVAREVEVEVEDARRVTLEKRDPELTPDEASELRSLKASAETREALADSGLEASKVVPTPGDVLANGTPGPVLIDAESIRSQLEREGKRAGGDGNGAAPDFAGVDFASDEAAEAAAAAGLEAEDFKGEGSGKDGAFTKGDVGELAAEKG